MSLAAILLGIINIAIVVAILVLIGAVIVWFLSLLQFPVPWNVQQIYLAIVALIALYMLVALLLGMPSVRLIGFRSITDPAIAALSAGAAVNLQGLLTC